MASPSDSSQSGINLNKRKQSDSKETNENDFSTAAKRDRRQDSILHPSALNYPLAFGKNALKKISAPSNTARSHIRSTSQTTPSSNAPFGSNGALARLTAATAAPIFVPSNTAHSHIRSTSQTTPNPNVPLSLNGVLADVAAANNSQSHIPNPTETNAVTAPLSMTVGLSSNGTAPDENLNSNKTATNSIDVDAYMSVWKNKSAVSKNILEQFTDFKQVNGNKMSAKCKHCDESQSAKNFIKGNNSNLKGHLERVLLIFYFFI